MVVLLLLLGVTAASSSASSFSEDAMLDKDDSEELCVRSFILKRSLLRPRCCVQQRRGSLHLRFFFKATNLSDARKLATG